MNSEPRAPSSEPRASSPDRDRIRVVYLAHTLAVGGAEEMVLNLVRHLPSRFEPMVCCINSAGPMGEEIRRTGTPVSVLGLTPGWRRPWHLAGLRRYLRETKPAIVHTFLLTASLYGRLAALLERVPIVIGTEVNIYERKQRHHILVGDGDLRDVLKDDAKALAIASRVHFLGARRDLGDLLTAMDVFVMPSLWEGLPLSMILAMGAALPVVATAVAGIPEILEDGKTGWLVPARSVIGVSAALSDVLSDRGRASAIGQAARDFALPRFGIDTYGDSIASLY